MKKYYLCSSHESPDGVSGTGFGIDSAHDDLEAAVEGALRTLADTMIDDGEEKIVVEIMRGADGPLPESDDLADWLDGVEPVTYQVTARGDEQADEADLRQRLWAAVAYYNDAAD